jgi:RND family efflux transporter MFP subunit
VLAVFVLLLGGLAAGLLPRLSAKEALKQQAQALNTPTVSVIQPKAGAATQELILPGNVEAFVDTPIYARTSGYLKRWYADIGARVKAGQLLAEIETPEVDDQLQQARAEVATAQANYEIARKTATRFGELSASGMVSKQDLDQAQGTMQAREAAVQSARFNVSRLEKLQAFKRIYAPFDGIVTARNVDVGALIDAGGGQGKALFHIGAADRLRVYVQVPQAYSQQVQPGVEAELTLTEFPGRRFPAKLVRTTQAIDKSTRSMLAEVAVDNRGGELLPGAYAQVHLKLPGGAPALVVPVNTLLFRPEGTQVAVVDAQQRVALKTIALGRDFGTEIEVLSGLSPAEAVILNPSDALVAGVQVRVVKAPEHKSESKPKRKPEKQGAAAMLRYPALAYASDKAAGGPT